MSTIHGHVRDVGQKTMGDELVAATASGATTLVVNDVADFDEEGGFLAINGAVLEYASCDDDTDSIELLDPLPAAAEASDRVDVWDLDNGKAVVSYVALVAVDGMDLGDPLEVEVDHDLADKLRQSIRVNGGESVTIERDGSQLSLAKVHGKVAETDNAFSYYPIIFAHRAIPTTPWATGEWLEIPGWTITEQEDIVYDGAGWWRFNSPGLYEAVGSVAFENGGGGVRGVRFVFEIDGGPAAAGTTVMVPSNVDTSVGFTGLQVVQKKRFNAGDRIQLQGRQVSGASLDLLGAADGSRTSITIERTRA